MTSAIDPAVTRSAAIMVDEVGIRYAVVGDVRLRTIFNPIFALRAGAIVPVGVSAIDARYQGGKQRTVRASIGQDDGAGEGALFRRLHLHNLQNVAETPLDLHLAPDPEERDFGAVTLDMAHLVDEGAAIGIKPGQIVCDLTDMGLKNPDAVIEGMAILRRAGARISLDTAAMSRLGGGVAQAHPDIVRLPAHWFHVLAGDPGSVRLLTTMVATLARHGTKVQAEGIESGSHLRMAMEAKVDLLQGPLLGEPAMAGAAFDEEPRPITKLLGSFGTIVTLFSR